MRGVGMRRRVQGARAGAAGGRRILPGTGLRKPFARLRGGTPCAGAHRRGQMSLSTAQRLPFASNPIPGASGIPIRLSRTGVLSAKPPKGAKTSG